MCLITKQIMPRVATKDIIAYKVMYMPKMYTDHNKIMSFFEHFKYIFGKLYYEPNMLMKPEIVGIYRVILKGFHSYKEQRSYDLYISSNIALYEVVIPKGSHYYISIDGKEIVSNQIIINKIIDI